MSHAGTPDKPADGQRRPRPARHDVYGELMWPEWNTTSESHGTSYEQANTLLDAMDTETRDHLADWFEAHGTRLLTCTQVAALIRDRHDVNGGEASS